MALPTCNEDMNIISKLDDEPNDVGGLSATSLKAKFDLAGNLLKKALNDLVAALGENAAAKNIGFAPTTAVNKTNVQDAIENVQSQIAGVTQGGIADASITPQKIAPYSLTAGQVKVQSLTGKCLALRTLQDDDDGDLTFTAQSTVSRLSTHWLKALSAAGMVFFEAKFNGLSDADVANRRLLISCAEDARPTQLGGYSARVVYKTGGVMKHVVAPAFTILGDTRMLCVDLPDDVTTDKASVTVSGWYFA